MNFQDYISAQDVAIKWDVTVRQVQKMCSSGKIIGVIRFGNAWAIPRDTQKPTKTRRKKPGPKSNMVPSGTINGTIKSDENTARLLKVMSDNPKITYDGLSKLLGIPRRTISREMKKLQDNGKIEREGARKTGRWIVIQ